MGNNNLIDGVSAVAVGAYICTVAYKGNVMELGGLLKSETGYVDFVIALFALGAIQKYGPAGKISTALTMLTLAGLAIKVGERGNLSSALSDFAAGRAGIAETFKSIVGAE